MGTWTDLPHTAALLNAADSWKRNCLLKDGSIFTDTTIWTLENLQQLHSLFVDHPILGKQKFYDKLHTQIAAGSSEVKKLAAEALWVLLLIVSESVLGVDTKRERISGVWTLSGEELPASHNLEDNVLRGLANPGIAFLTKIWMEFAFLLTVLVRWKSTDASDRNRLLLDNPWDFCEWVSQNEGADVRAFRHILLFLCYPKYFERICSKGHKKEIYSTFAGKLSRDDPYHANQTLCALDRSIFQIRSELTNEFETESLDFYRPPLRSQWLMEEEEEAKTETKAAEIIEGGEIGSAPRYWVEKTIWPAPGSVDTDLS
jgi:5-methylcytosine-specific restriction protein B